MDKINNLSDITHTFLASKEQKKAVSKYCLDNQFFLDDLYLETLKKLINKRKRVIDDNDSVQFVINLPSHQSSKIKTVGIGTTVTDYDCFLKTRASAAGALERATAEKSAPLSDNKAEKTDNFILNDRLLVEKQPLKCNDNDEQLSLFNRMNSQMSHLQEQSYSIGMGANHKLPDNDNQCYKIDETILVSSQQNSPLLPHASVAFNDSVNKQSVSDDHLTDVYHQYQMPEITVLAKEKTMVYHFHKWSGNHSVAVKFEKTDGEYIHLAPSDFMVEQRLTDHLYHLPTRFKIYFNHDQFGYRHRDDDLDDDKDQE